MTVLDACLKVLKDSGRPLNVKQILYEIETRNLYVFKAKDSVKVISGAIRNNLKKGKPPIVKETAKGRFGVA